MVAHSSQYISFCIVFALPQWNCLVLRRMLSLIRCVISFAHAVNCEVYNIIWAAKLVLVSVQSSNYYNYNALRIEKERSIIITVGLQYIAMHCEYYFMTENNIFHSLSRLCNESFASVNDWIVEKSVVLSPESMLN